jgi:hypothetical protein
MRLQKKEHLSVRKAVLNNILTEFHIDENGVSMLNYEGI